MKKRLVWEPFQDPFKNIEMEHQIIYDDEDEEVGNVADLVPVLATPTGFYPIGKNVKLIDLNAWNCITNFDVTQDTVNILNIVPGIQDVRVHNRYEMIVIIGKLFETSAVMSAVHKALGVEFEKKDPQKEKISEEIAMDAQEKIRDLKQKFKFWCLYIAPNGKSHTFGSETESEILPYLEAYRETEALVGGAVFSSCTESPVLK